MKLRNPLYAPADSERKLTKALASEADAIIVDLEDSVGASQKETARAAMEHVLSQQVCSRIIVRINGTETPWYLADLAAVVRSRAGAVMLPKCQGLEDLMRLEYQLDAFEHAFGISERTKIFLLATETVRSLRHLSYVGHSDRLCGLVFGAEDLAAELGISVRGCDGKLAAPIAFARAALLVAAAEAQVPAIDTPWPSIKDLAGLKDEATASCTDGFVGKQCIHPEQLEIVSQAFTPTAERVRWARTVREVFATHAGMGVLKVDGAMVDRPHLLLAERILASAGE